MPLPSPPSSPAGSPSRPAWYRLSRWFGGGPKASARAGAARGPAPADADAQVDGLRTQARRRLIGAVVLLAAGVIAFPLVFETDPRPMGVDMPMQRVQGSVSAAPAPLSRGTAEDTAVAVLQNPSAPAPAGPPADTSAGAVQPAPAPAVQTAPTAPPPAPPPVSPPTPAPAPALSTAPPAAADRAPPDRAQAQRADAERAAEAQRARALLEGRSAATPVAPAQPTEPLAAARYVVQVGAFTEKRALAEARSRVERLGLKTYTQVIESPAGPRTRVRVGPFGSRAEADAAGAKLKAAGLPFAVLTL